MLQDLTQAIFRAITASLDFTKGSVCQSQLEAKVIPALSNGIQDIVQARQASLIWFHYKHTCTHAMCDRNTKQIRSNTLINLMHGQVAIRLNTHVKKDDKEVS